MTLDYSFIPDETSYPPHGREGEGLRASVWVLSGLGWVVAGLAAVGVMTGLLMLVGGGGSLGVGGVPAAILILLAVAFMYRAARRSRAMTILGYLEQATRLNLPLPDMLLAAERAERGATARWLGRLRER